MGRQPSSPSHRGNPPPRRNISAEIHSKPASNRSPPNKAADPCQISAASTDSAAAINSSLRESDEALA